MTPTARTLQWCRDQGFPAQVVERFNIYSKTRLDLFGYIDVLYLDTTRLKIVGVQVTSTGNLSSRRHKIVALRSYPLTWLACGSLIELHGWSKKGPHGKRKLWTLTRQNLTAEEIAATGPQPVVEQA